MDDIMNKFVFHYDIDSVRDAYESMNKGRRMPLSPQMKADLETYKKYIAYELTQDEELVDSALSEHEKIERIIEKRRRMASTEDVLVIQLSEDQKAKLREEMSVSIVRPNPDSIYNKLDSELFDSAEKRDIYLKLSKIDKAYYHAEDYVKAINTIMEAIKYSLEHDYPQFTKEEAYEAFNRGEIKFTYKQIPVLYNGWTTIIDDPKVLAGIVEGRLDVTSNNDDEGKARMKRTREARGEAVPSDYDVELVGPNEYSQQYQMHQRGIDTPISPIINASIGAFSRFSLPSSNMFYNNKVKEKEDRAPISFDWMQDDAGEKYYNIVNNVQVTTDDIIETLMTANGGNLSDNGLRSDIDEFIRQLKTPVDPNQNTVHNLYDTAMVQTQKPEIVALEQHIISQMKMANPNKH